MTHATPSGVLSTILPCNDLDISERFYNHLGLARAGGKDSEQFADTYGILFQKEAGTRFGFAWYSGVAPAPSWPTTSRQA